MKRLLREILVPTSLVGFSLKADLAARLIIPPATARTIDYRSSQGLPTATSPFRVQATPSVNGGNDNSELRVPSTSYLGGSR